jgi:uncharacterized protein
MSKTATRDDVLARFAHAHYLNLETFRKNGAGVKTPLWFVAEGDTLYASAPSHTGKVKRLRHTARVRVVPCDSRGTPQGDWLDARATFVTGEEAARADRLLARKYGFQRKLLDLFGKLKRWDYTIIAIRL